MFRAHVLIVRWSKLCYTVSGTITPMGGRPVHNLCTGRPPSASSWLILINKYIEIHGQQNIKIKLWYLIF